MTSETAWPSIGTGSRQRLVECAVSYRIELVARHRAPTPRRPPSAAESEANRRYWLERTRFEQAVAALPRHDRLARRLADQWLELSGWVFGAKHLGLQTSEDVAWSFLRRLATNECPSSATREVLRSAKAVPPGDWLLDWRDHLQVLVDVVRYMWTITPPRGHAPQQRR